MSDHETTLRVLGEMPDRVIRIEWTEERRSACLAGADALRAVETLTAERDEARALHQELMFQVGKKYPGETRHETARRYLREHEDHCNQGGPACDAPKEVSRG